jgi:hypothetical protein
MYLIFKVIVTLRGILCSAGRQNLSMERTCHLDILPLIIGMLTIWQSLILNAALRSAMCRYSEISSLIRKQNAIMLASIDADVVRGKTKFMFWNSSQ